MGYTWDDLIKNDDGLVESYIEGGLFGMGFETNYNIIFMGKWINGTHDYVTSAVDVIMKEHNVNIVMIADPAVLSVASSRNITNEVTEAMQLQSQ